MVEPAVKMTSLPAVPLKDPKLAGATDQLGFSAFSTMNMRRLPGFTRVLAGRRTGVVAAGSQLTSSTSQVVEPVGAPTRRIWNGVVMAERLIPVKALNNISWSTQFPLVDGTVKKFELPVQWTTT